MKILRYFFAIFAIFIVAFFCVFFNYLYRFELDVSQVNLGQVRITKGNKTYFCGGVVIGEYLVSVKHVFNNANIGISAYQDIGIGRFFNIPSGINVAVNGVKVEHTYIFLYEKSDLAFIKLSDLDNSATCSAVWDNGVINCSTKNSLQERYFLPKSTRFVYQKSNYLGTSVCGNGELLRYSGIVEKGASGYPVLDKSGYVNGIICSRDTTKNVTYAVPISEVLDVLNALDG